MTFHKVIWGCRWGENWCCCFAPITSLRTCTWVGAAASLHSFLVRVVSTLHLRSRVPTEWALGRVLGLFWLLCCGWWLVLLLLLL